MKAPSSRARLCLRLSWFDAIWAFIAPVLALILRDYEVFLNDAFPSALAYCVASTLLSVGFFGAFGIRDALPSYFSVRDALEVIKAALTTTLASCLLVFALTRLEGLPRSTPFIHGLVLICGLLAARGIGRLFFVDETVIAARPAPAEHIIMIGSNHVTSAFIGLLQACSSSGNRVVAVVDDRPNLTGRTISRVRIVGTSKDLDSLVDEFEVHGVRIDRVLIGGGEDLLTPDALGHVQRVCEQRAIELDFVPHLAFLRVLPAHHLREQPELAQQSEFAETSRFVGAPRPLLLLKRMMDITVASIALAFLVPIMLLVSIAILFNIGTPVLFWQQRKGVGGRNILVHKFRTLRAPFDRQGHPIPDEKRLSRLGKFLRQTHLDELPQLLNVLVGDMSLVGPRPLLPIDQPPDPTVRLSVRPGLTGWAQINGGKQVSIPDKASLDEWYVKHMSFYLDVYILALTAAQVFRGGSPETWDGDASARASWTEQVRRDGRARSR